MRHVLCNSSASPASIRDPAIISDEEMVTNTVKQELIEGWIDEFGFCLIAILFGYIITMIATRHLNR